MSNSVFPPARVAVLAEMDLLQDAIAALLRESAVDAITLDPNDVLADALLGDAPDVIVLPEATGHDIEETLAGVRARHPGARIVVIVADAASDTAARVAGLDVDGLVDAHARGRELAEVVRQVAAGRRVLPLSVVLDGDGTRRRLSPRQREVLRLVASGRSNVEIADALTITVNTVKFHVRTIFRELGIHNRVEAARWWASGHAQGHLIG